MRRALLVCVLLVATGCGVPTDDEPRALNPNEAPFQIFDSAAPSPEGEGRVALYFVRGDLVVLQPRAVERSTTIREVLDLLLDGPTREQVAAGTSSSIPAGLTVEDLEVSPTGVAVVTLDGGDDTPSISARAFAQIVATLTAPGRARAVRFRLDGEDLPVPRGDGSVTTEPVDREDYADLLLLQGSSPTPASASPAPS